MIQARGRVEKGAFAMARVGCQGHGKEKQDDGSETAKTHGQTVALWCRRATGFRHIVHIRLVILILG